MPRRDFQRDVVQACIPGLFSRLTDVKAGGEDGLISFTYTAPSNTHRIDVQVTVSDTSEYPESHEYFAYTVSENVPRVVSTTLEAWAFTFTGLSVHDFLTAISECLDEATLSGESQCELLESSDNDFESDEMDWVDSYDRLLYSTSYEGSARGNIRADLWKTRNAGFRVGHLGDLNGRIILSASRRISKLGISNEAMEAWGVNPSEYLVLLIHYLRGYCPLIDVVRNRESRLVKMYVGVCESYKPSLASAYHVLEISNPSGSHAVTDMEPVLNAISFGKSLHALLNNCFIHILRCRLDYGFSWTGAELYVNDGQGKLKDTGDRSDARYRQADSWDTSSPAFLSEDHLEDMETPNDMSLLLIAMQFTLRRFVKCTEFCLNCYCKADPGFEALRPFVCSKSLCLYQYMTLGLGPSLDWEISSQPLVVDLLISFAYVRAVSRKLDGIPEGTGLRVPHPARGKDNNIGIYKAHLRPAEGHGLWLRVVDRRDIRAGDWIAVMYTVEVQSNIPSEVHARVEDISEWPNVRISDPVFRSPLHQNLWHKTPYTGDVSFVPYDRDFSTLGQEQKLDALICLLDTLPTVMEMKRFVDKRRGGHLRTLSEWTERIHPSALYILQWIVWSNRSVIMHDDDPQRRVSGMESYVQFRFAQGAPDKEQRFVAAVNKNASHSGLKYPTLFAWHGSPLHNWHNIVREGLRFDYMAHGRSYGHGVYMAQDFNTSLGYCAHSVGSYWVWPNSTLRFSSAISLNEVVNAPQLFVSYSPYYVVHQLDWVQPRYLFVQSQASSKNQRRLEPMEDIYVQDPKRQVFGPGGHPVTIPISATNSHRAQTLLRSTAKGEREPTRQGLLRNIFKPKRRGSPTTKDCAGNRAEDRSDDDDDGDDMDSIATLMEDRLLLLSDREEGFNDDQAMKHLDDQVKTDFLPGSLDRSSIQLLGEPAHATPMATKVLQKELRVALRTQKKEKPHELGWYIHGDLITNVYQWIVELHSFDSRLPLAQDLKAAGMTSLVMEIRFPTNFPMAPPFMRLIRPRLLRFSEGGGGHVTAGGAMCMELLTNSGWIPSLSIENVLLQVRMAVTNREPQPARLDRRHYKMDYNVGEAIAEYKRVCTQHGWAIPSDIDQFSWS